jgi:hypothetical protein
LASAPRRAAKIVKNAIARFTFPPYLSLQRSVANYNAGFPDFFSGHSLQGRCCRLMVCKVRAKAALNAYFDSFFAFPAGTEEIPAQLRRVPRAFVSY